MMVANVALEPGVAQVAPQHGEHAEFVGTGERLAHLLDLPGGLLGSEVDGGPDAGRPEVVGLVHRAEHDLVELVRQGQQFVVVELHDERDAVGVAARHGTQHANGRGDGVAAALDRQLHDVGGIEVGGVGREGGRSRVLDALVDGKDRHVPGAPQATVVQQRLEAAQHL